MDQAECRISRLENKMKLYCSVKENDDLRKTHHRNIHELRHSMRKTNLWIIGIEEESMAWTISSTG